MKLILAIIRIAKMQETKMALSDAGLPSFTAMAVLGRGKGHGDLEKAEEVNPQLHEFISDTPRFKSKRLITLVVTDDKKDLAVKTIMDANHTGKSGDGKIFVVNTIDSIRVRNGESGDLTLD
ncbi:P-II family nitrogen regulator [Natronoflexus pectinivorans]|uniref:Nitrogen regulatory protein P-II family n=1 Tax=Natronoflexus pectinivorans TaxID=682526 RepID=A0A4R2GG20_9BACT|nr:P-II family nitrogen regulator [Natronoflexus pectinivorans]TCO07131.1 nitrogen regulatory protein P-II family [Natronoflexus pectinivorans]